MNLDPTLAEMQAQRAVEVLYSNLALRMGEKNAVGYAELFTTEGVIEAPGRESLAKPEIVAALTASLRRFDTIQYLVTDVLTDVAGERATSTAQVLAVHLFGPDAGSAWYFGGRFACSHEIEDGRWRFSSLALTHVWQHGSPPAVGVPS